MSCCGDPIPYQPLQPVASVASGVKVFHGQYPVPGHPLQALQFTLPQHDGIQRKFHRPFFHLDGSIEYPRLTGDNDPPSDIQGYQRDASNPWRFVPLWPGCPARHQGTKMLASGCIDVHMFCDQVLAPTFRKEVSFDTCVNCPHKNSPYTKNSPAS